LNNNSQSLKDNVVNTPPIVADKIYNDLKRKHIHTILDIGSGEGALSEPFRSKKNIKIIGNDITDEHAPHYKHFIHQDFLLTTKEDYQNLNIDLIVSNPPFQSSKEHNELYPFLFLEHIFKLFGSDMPVVIIVPQWLLSSSNKRISKLNEWNITKTITMHGKIFRTKDNYISVESSILYFNIKSQKQVEFLESKKPSTSSTKNRHFKSITLKANQKEFIEQNFNNFNKEIKELIRDKYPLFPL
jgi:hypothetical protein